MYGIIYKTTYLLTGEWYVGQHKCTEDKFDGYLGSGVIISDYLATHDHSLFKRTTLAIAETEQDLNDLEVYYIAVLNCVEDPHCWNFARGGKGPDYWAIPEKVEVAKKKMSESAKKRDRTGELPPPKHTKEELQQYAAERWAKQENRDHAAQKSKEYWDSPAGQARRKQPVFKHPYNANKKALCIETGIIYESATEAAKATGFSQSMICAACRGSRKTAGKMHWKYIDAEAGDVHGA